MLVEQLRSDVTDALKARDQMTADTLRLTLARVREAEVAGATERVLSDDEVRAVIARGVKERDEARAAYLDAGRVDLADIEAAQREILAAYLPAPLSADEVTEIVARVVADNGFSGGGDMGAAMKAVRAEIAGRADGKAVADAVKSALGI